MPLPQSSWLLLRLLLQGAAKLKMYGLAYITASSPQPGSSLSADGHLLLHQAAPLPASIMSAALDKPLLDSSAALGGAAVQGDMVLQLSSLFSSYQAQNVTTVYENQYPVWKVSGCLQCSRLQLLDVWLRLFVGSLAKS